MSVVKPKSEKKLFLELLEFLKELPCLWDFSHKDYTNKEARTRGYDLLLEKYHLIDPEATLQEMKKKLEHMRASYRRERKKVNHELLKYGEERKPTLWYYDYFRFLDGDQEDFENPEVEDDEDITEKPPVEADLSSIFLKEDHNDFLMGHVEEDNQPGYVSEDKTRANVATALTEGEAFGKAIGLQLNELHPVQRFIAEKLISEVIYYGRFEKLDISTRLNNVQ